MSEEQDLIGPIDKDLAKALFLAAKPLARLAWSVRLQNTPLLEIVKLAAMEVAIEEAEKAGQRLTIKWVRLTTGVSRPKVEKHFSEIDFDAWIAEIVEEASARSPHARVLRTWLTDPRFSDNGVAKPLPRSQKHGSPNFYDLVREADDAFGAATVLSDLKEAGAVRLINDDVELLKTAYTHRPGDEMQASIREDFVAAENNLVELWFQEALKGND